MRLTPAQVSALASAQRGRTEASKAAARVIHVIDRGVPRSAARLAAELNDQGLSYSANAVGRLRYVARLLATLDPKTLDPQELADITDMEVLYRLQRAAEITHRSPHELLRLWESEKPADPSAWLGTIIKTKNISAPAEARESWKTPLARVPLSVANEINLAFTAFRKGRGMTELQASQELPGLLRGDSGVTAAVTAWADEMNLTPEQAENALGRLLRALPAEHWERLIALLPTLEACSE